MVLATRLRLWTIARSNYLPTKGDEVHDASGSVTSFRLAGDVMGTERVELITPASPSVGTGPVWAAQQRIQSRLPDHPIKGECHC
jgi:hypothetical protein